MAPQPEHPSNSTQITTLHKRITELEESIETFKRREYEIRQREAMFRRLLEEASDAIVLADEKGLISFINSKVSQIFGYTRDELIGQPVEILVPERYVHKHEKHRKKYINAPHSHPMGKGRYLTGLRKDGTEVEIEIGLSYVRLIGKIFTMSYIIDITQRHEMEVKIEQQNQQLNHFFSRANNALENLTRAIEQDAPKNEILDYLKELSEGLNTNIA